MTPKTTGLAAAAAVTVTLIVGAPWATSQSLGSVDQERQNRNAVARVAYAEAGDQGDSGLAAVVFVILNRLASGGWGSDIESIVNGKDQFEPVSRAGGDWRRLPPISAVQQARIDTIINLTLDGRLPDLTNGAEYFQNPAVVSERVRLGTAPPQRIKFGMSRPTAVIGSHWFFGDVAVRRGSPRQATDGGPIFVQAEPPTQTVRPHPTIDVGGKTLSAREITPQVPR